MSFYSRKYITFISDSFALYGLDELPKEKVQMWFDYVVLLSEKSGYLFNEGCCSPGNTKYVSFKNCKRTFEKNIDTVDSLELRYSIRRDDKRLPPGGEIVDAQLNKYFKECRFGIYNILSNEKLCSEIGVELCKITQPKYGIFYRFPFVFSPWTYASDLTNTEYDDVPGKYYNEKHVDIVKRISCWKKKSKNKACEQGYLREIYPINFINEKHLNHQVFPKITLRDWIKASDHRGTLTQITEELHMWLVPDEDLEPITIVLAPSDILLCVNKEDPHQYDYGVRPEDQIVLENEPA